MLEQPRFKLLDGKILERRYYASVNIPDDLQNAT